MSTSSSACDQVCSEHLGLATRFATQSVKTAVKEPTSHHDIRAFHSDTRSPLAHEGRMGNIPIVAVVVDRWVRMHTIFEKQICVGFRQILHTSPGNWVGWEPVNPSGSKAGRKMDFERMINFHCQFLHCTSSTVPFMP